MTEKLVKNKHKPFWSGNHLYYSLFLRVCTRPHPSFAVMDTFGVCHDAKLEAGSIASLPVHILAFAI